MNVKLYADLPSSCCLPDPCRSAAPPPSCPPNTSALCSGWWAEPRAGGGQNGQAQVEERHFVSDSFTCVIGTDAKTPPLTSRRSVWVWLPAGRQPTCGFTCPGSLAVGVRLLVPVLSSSSSPRSFIPFLRRLDWHCTSVRRPARFTNPIFSVRFEFLC